MKNPEFSNDNEELSFISLSAATKNVMAYLRNEKQKQDAAQHEACGQSNQCDGTEDFSAQLGAVRIERRIVR